jgi:peptidoglycan hydrolase CwlO-like protein
MYKRIQDIIKKSEDISKGRSNFNRINLSSLGTKTIIVPLKKISVFVIISFAIFSFILGSAYAPINNGYLFAASTREEERAQLEAQLKDLEKQISDYENTVEQYKKQGKSLESEIKTINAKIAKLNLQIKAINLNLDRLDSEIDSTKSKITETESDITINKKSLSSILQNIYESETTSVIEMVLANPKLSDFFLDINNLMAVQDNLRIALEEIVRLKNQLIDQKEALALEYEDISQLKAYQESQRSLVKKTEDSKKELLKVTKGQESKYQDLLKETQKTAAQIRSRIFEFFGGGELSFGEAYKFAKLAQDATGVRAALILAVLDRESALGRNVGKCKYNVNPYYPDRASNPTTMHPTRDIPIFLEITSELGINPDSIFVSCPIPSDGAYGGAMGPAQFIPSTWNGYKEQVSALTGNNPSSPWNNMDAFMATALYLKSAGAAGGSLYDEKVAAAKYYAGGRWKYYISTYGERVVSRAQSFQEDIDVLNG